MILLECSRAEHAERNGMKRYCGCSSPDERRKRPCEDEERNSAKKRAAFFLSCPFILCCEVPVERWKEDFSADDRLEQPSRTKEATGERPLNCPYCLERKCSFGNNGLIFLILLVLCFYMIAIQLFSS